MTHYHLYIDAGATIDSTSRFYKVAIGTSRQALRDQHFLLHHAAAHNHYFVIWSHEVDVFLSKIKISLYPDSILLEPIAARDLVRNFKTFIRQPFSQVMLEEHSHQESFFNLDYRIFSKIHGRK